MQRICEGNPDGINPLGPPKNPESSKYPILANIFTFLSPEDLESCCRVSKHWKEIAGPLMYFHYDVEIHVQNSRRPKPLVLIKRALYNRENLKRFEMEYAEVIQNLEETLDNHKMVVNLTIFGLDFYNQNRSLENFLSKFGYLVIHLNYSVMQNVHLNYFGNFLMTFPNLKSLHCSNFWLTKDSTEFEGFNSELPQKQLKKLKKIYFGMSVQSPIETLGRFLKIAPNLEQIENLPIWLVDAIVFAGKVSCLKSIYYSFDNKALVENGLTIVTAFEKLAKLRPKLSSFSLLTNGVCFEEKSTVDMVKPSIFSILESSAKYLRFFELGPTERYGFVKVPRLDHVDTLVLKKPCIHFDKARYFSTNISLEEKFPEVREIRLLGDWDDKSNNQYLNEMITSSWRSQIKRVLVGDLTVRSLPMLKKLFTSVEHFEFSGSVNDLGKLLRAIPNFLHQLKSVTINVTDGGGYSNSSRSRPELIDCAITGLPRDVVCKLLDPNNGGMFSKQQIQNFKCRSPLLKFKDLQRLNLSLPSTYTCITPKSLHPKLTHISYSFGFNLLPHLKVSVGKS